MFSWKGLFHDFIELKIVGIHFDRNVPIFPVGTLVRPNCKTGEITLNLTDKQ